MGVLSLSAFDIIKSKRLYFFKLLTPILNDPWPGRIILSALFIIFYVYLIKSNASITMLIPFILLLIMIYSISSLAMRENMEEYKNSLKNITNIESLK